MLRLIVRNGKARLKEGLDLPFGCANWIVAIWVVSSGGVDERRS